MNTKPLCIDKPTGWTSFDVVAKIRGRIRAHYTAQGVKPTKRQLRVGHAGTLDPFATGLLLVLLGDDCKKAGDFLKLDKTYEATFRLGATSSTGDPEGEVTSVSSEVPSEEVVRAAMRQLTGEIMQTPPAYSAIKIGGKRAYKLAREGVVPELEARPVHIHSFELLHYEYPDVQVRVHVGSGTYIRSLAEDLGKLLGTGAYCVALRRTHIDTWSVAAAVDPESVELPL